MVFTKSATDGLKLVGETFPWSQGSMFRYLRENHNSVLGVREYALQGGGAFQVRGRGGGRGREGPRWSTLRGLRLRLRQAGLRSAPLGLDPCSGRALAMRTPSFFHRL